MSDAEIERIFRSLDRIENRLAELEKREASRDGADAARNMTKGRVIAWVTGIAAIVGVTSTLASQLLTNLGG